MKTERGFGTYFTQLNAVHALHDVVGTDGDSQTLLEGIGHDVGDRSFSGDVSGQRYSSNIGNTTLEDLQHIVIGHFQHLTAVKCTVVVDVQQLDTVVERLDSQHQQQRRLRLANLVALPQDGLIFHDFDCPLGNLGVDVQGLEELGLGGPQTGVASGNDDCTRREQKVSAGARVVLVYAGVPLLVGGRMHPSTTYRHTGKRCPDEPWTESCYRHRCP